MSKSRRQRAHPQGTNARQPHGPPARVGIARDGRAPTSRARPASGWRCSTGTAPTAATSAARPATSATRRPTVYRWLARFDRRRLETSRTDRRPHRRRRPTWTLRRSSPRSAGCASPTRAGARTSSAVLLRREGLALSVSMVGRILAASARSGELREPARRRISARKRAWPRPHAVRKPAGLRGRAPGRPRPARHARRASRCRGSCSSSSPPATSSAAGTSSSSRRSASARSAVAILEPWRPGLPFAVRALRSTAARSSWPSSSGLRRARASSSTPCRLAPPSSTAASSGPTAPTPRSSTTSPTPSRPWPTCARPCAPGSDLQHDPSPPGPGLPHPRRVPASTRARCVTEVPNEYRGLTTRRPAWILRITIYRLTY